jgi:DNA-binding beta-propeller fold protein YncE
MANDEFVQFTEAVAPRLRRTAFLLCGDWHTAEDLAQTTLARVFASWRRIRNGDAVSAYAMRTLLNTYLATLYESFVGPAPHHRYFTSGLLGVNTAANTALKPIMVKNFAGLQLAYAAGGATLYWAGFNSVLAIDTATNKPLKRIFLPGTSDSYIIASSPDASTVYAADQNATASKSWVVRISAATK